MHIKSVTVQNVKSFRDQHRFDLEPGVNFFVGDNNSGKSTVLEALLFVFQGPSATQFLPEKFYCSDAAGPTRVVVDIAGGTDTLVNQDKFSVLKDFVFENGGDHILRLERSSEDRTVIQSGKKKDVGVKAVCFWHPEREQFENVTGIDAKVKAIFDFEAVWADAHPSEHIDFASNKTLGRLLDSSFGRFVETDRWKALADAHEKAFSLDEEGSFFAETKTLADGIKKLVDEQYGQANYRFDFGLPDASVFKKQGRLHVDDGAGETPVDGKGTGMQRAIALGIIQYYARSGALLDDNNPTPLILMLDEPETWLHPTAQLKLGDALSRIGEREQVFIVTHSPYLIRKFDSVNHLLTVLSGQGSERRIDPSTKFGLFGSGEPTWGEINYRAFEVFSNDFHNELYGHIQRHIEKEKKMNSAQEKVIDDYLCESGITKSKTWRRNENQIYPRTLPVYVRNSIHHPENRLNDR
ncbi:ATP-binding protein [Kocuria sp. cx-116]|uniref:ATP-dependent nuclease n=1 Tax=Kocuria sp. cx-116 TaxID=2771378 RepID=UPI0016891904|nr:AAA family ATPase [Kocuria sp. cx-116]MBD2763420.1 ATP-binding protein [Kocuria sp. cx-116]